MGEKDHDPEDAGIIGQKRMDFESNNRSRKNTQSTVATSDEHYSAEYQGRPPKSKKERCYEFIESPPVISFMVVITIYALYADDIRVLTFKKPADPIFVIFSSIAFFLFLTEIILHCWCHDDYFKLPELTKIRWTRIRYVWRDIQKYFSFGSLYFWLDFIATLSMIMELPWITSLAAGTFDGGFGESGAGRASRAGARAAKVIRVVRMIRLVRLVKLYKYLSANNPNQKKEGKVVPEEDNDELSNMPPETHIGAEISGRLTKKCIVGILIMLVVIPLFQVQPLEYINEFGMHMVLDQRLAIGENGTVGNWLHTENHFLSTSECISLEYSGFEDGLRDFALIPEGRADPNSLRQIEKSILSIRSRKNSGIKLSAAFDWSKKATDEAFFQILLITFVLFLLVVGTMTFSRDVNNLVITPIEKMVQLVKEISTNPLGKDISLSPDDLMPREDDMETTVLLRTISKIAGLMRVGFGEAGAEIIGKNLRVCCSTSGGYLNVLGNGTKILSIFGFCDVRNFTAITECLQEEVMLFVNRIAHILHSVVVQCDGAANKNIGDAFLLTWKLDPNSLGSCKDHNYAADKALYSLVKTMIEMVRHEDFISNFSPSALGCLYEKLPRYRCTIGCGLHFGWAIEGAIGSDKKIDASYISPHVNWAEFLESSTKKYNVPILLSEPFVKLLSPNVTQYCRKVDNIKKTETDEVTALFTYDMDLNNVGMVPHKVQPRKRSLVGSRKRKTIIPLAGSNPVVQQQRLERVPSVAKVLEEAPEINLSPFDICVWEEDGDMVDLREHITEKFRNHWNIGIEAFVDGDWGKAHDELKHVLALTENKDGPSLQLIERMKESDFRPPSDWLGYRKLY